MVISNNFIDKNWIYVVFAGYNIEGGGAKLDFKRQSYPTIKVVWPQYV